MAVKKEKSQMEKFDESLTKGELKAETYLEWPYETIGRCARAFAKELEKTEITGWKGIATMSSVYNLLHVAMSVNAEEFHQTIDGFTYKGVPQGEWEVIVRKVKAKKEVAPPHRKY